MALTTEDKAYIAAQMDRQEQRFDRRLAELETRIDNKIDSKLDSKIKELMIYMSQWLNEQREINRKQNIEMREAVGYTTIRFNKLRDGLEKAAAAGE